MSTTTTNLNFQTRLVKALEILMDRIYVPVSKTDIIIFVIGSAGAGKSTFLNTAISQDVMAVNDRLVSCAEDVESIKCTSPWNPFGRSVIFAEIPAFSHSDPTMEKKIPELISRWLTRTCCPEGPVDSGIIFLHSMASELRKREREDFKRHLDLFVTLCHANRHRPTTALLVTTMWTRKEGESAVIGELEEFFKKNAPSTIRPIEKSVRFDGSHASACMAINSLMMEIQQDVCRIKAVNEPVSIKDTIIFVIGPTGTGKGTFINIAISDKVMAINHELESHAVDVESVRCTSPWNLSGRRVVFVEIPAFNHSKLAMQRNIPNLITRWLIKNSSEEGPINSGIIYLHSMASHRVNEDFKKNLDPFVKLCHESGHKPTSVLLVSNLWYDESEEETYKKTLELEELFQKAASSAIRSIQHSIRFDESQISVYNAIDLLMLDMQLDA